MSRTRQIAVVVLFIASMPVRSTAAAINDPRLRTCDAVVAVRTAFDLIDQRILVEPIEVMGLSLVLYLNGRRDQAVFWYYAGLLRARQQLLVEPEKADQQELILTEGMIGSSIESYARLDVTKLVKTIEAVQTWDAGASNRFLDPINAKGLQSDRKTVLDRFDSMKASLIAERTTIESRERARAAQGDDYITQAHKQACGDESHGF